MADVVRVVQEEPLIAILLGVATGGGTLLLAFFTWRLARSTRADVEAQWRPLLVPARWDDQEMMGMTITGLWAAITDEAEFRFCFENVGKGAALGVRGLVRNPPGERIVYGNCDPLVSPVIAVATKAEFRQAVVGIEENRVRVRVDYKDLGGNAHHTEAEYLRRGDNTRWQIAWVVPGRTQYLKDVHLWLLALRWRAAAPGRWVLAWMRRLWRRLSRGYRPH